VPKVYKWVICQTDYRFAYPEEKERELPPEAWLLSVVRKNYMVVKVGVASQTVLSC